MSLTMANSMMSEENYFNLDWINENTGIDEEIIDVSKDCISVPSSPILPKIEAEDAIPTQIDDYVEIQVTEEEVVTEDWESQQNDLFDYSADVDGLNFRSGSEGEIAVPLEESQDEYSRLHPYPCDFCSRRFSKKAAMTVHMLSHQIERPHDCNLCGATYKRKFDLVEHLKQHAYPPEEKDDIEFVEHPLVPQAKPKIKRKKKKVNIEPKPPKLHNDFSNSNFSSELQEEMRLMVESVQPKFPVIDPARPYVCQECGVGFAREKALLSHNMLHVGDSAYECDRCHEMFPTQQLLSNHLAEKHAKNSHTVLKKKNIQHSTEVLHIKPESSELTDEHMCQQCSIIFNSAEELSFHKNDHAPEVDVHACYLCNEIYEGLTDLRDHIKTYHYSTHLCNQCDKVFTDKTLLNEHIASTHDKKMTCPVCNKQFSTKISFRKHISSHENTQQTLMCSECGRSFEDGGSLLTHRQVVHGLNLSRLFPCMECGKTFNSRSSQQIHVRIHTGEKPYACKYCWKAFGDGGTLRKHERIHTGEKPYVCPVCTKAFNQRVVLREHVRAHHSGTESRLNENCYECIVCGQLFVNSAELCAHLVQHSDENTAKHRVPVTRKTGKKRKADNTMVNTTLEETPSQSSMSNSTYTSLFPEEIGLEDDEDSYFMGPPAPPSPKKRTPNPAQSMENSLDTMMRAGETAIESMNSILKNSPKKARIVRSGKKGFHKGQNKRFQKGKSKTTRLLSNTSYASKYVVTQPDGLYINGEESDSSNLVDDLSDPILSNGNGYAPKKPRTKNVSYHNLKTEPRFELATFPSPSDLEPSQKLKKRKMSKKKDSSKPPKKINKVQMILQNPVDLPFVNGIDDSIFENNSSEPIETCIVDNIDEELKLEDPSESGLLIPKIEDDLEIKIEEAACDMCSEVFNSHSDLLKHIEVHI